MLRTPISKPNLLNANCPLSNPPCEGDKNGPITKCACERAVVRVPRITVVLKACWCCCRRVCADWCCCRYIPYCVCVCALVFSLTGERCWSWAILDHSRVRANMPCLRVTARSVCHCVAGLAATFEPKLTTVCVCALHQFAVTLCAWLRALLTYLNWCLVHGSCAVRGAWMWGVVVSANR